MEPSTKQPVTPAMRAEASAWIARLHGPQRNARTEAGFKSWLKANPAHARAFEQTTEAWEAIGSVPSERLSSMVRWDRVGSRSRWQSRPVWAAAATLLLAIAGAVLYVAAGSITTTAVGEQRVVTLQDGTRLHLNTASRVRVKYGKHSRHIDLLAGEALFEVAKDPRRAFTVRAGEREVTALGTTFLVRHDTAFTAVTLVEGKVSVTSPESAATQGAPTLASTATTNTGDVTLNPGQRLTFTGNRVPQLDQPSLDRVTAWQRGLVVLDGTKLVDAVAEMNRYGTVPLQIGNAEVAGVRVSGAFRAGDSLSFAQAVATTYRLQVADGKDRIVLSGRPQATY